MLQLFTAGIQKSLGKNALAVEIKTRQRQRLRRLQISLKCCARRHVLHQVPCAAPGASDSILKEGVFLSQIYNANETGFFYRSTSPLFLPSASLKFPSHKGLDGHGDNPSEAFNQHLIRHLNGESEPEPLIVIV